MDHVKSLLSSAEEGKIIREGLNLAIIGKPNVGKSSLLNTLLQEERALVTGLEEPDLVADVRADTVVNNPQLMRLWHQAGLSAVVIGFEEIDDARLARMNKRSSLEKNIAALRILDDIGIKVVGDFIISPDYDHADFEMLARFIESFPIALPIPSSSVTVMFWATKSPRNWPRFSSTSVSR